MTLDLLIRGGTVVDGTGAAPRTADVAIVDGRVAEVGRVAVVGPMSILPACQAAKSRTTICTMRCA